MILENSGKQLKWNWRSVWSY